MKFLGRHWGKILWVIFWTYIATLEGKDGTPPLLEKDTLISLDLIVQPPLVFWICTRAGAKWLRWLWAASMVFLPVVGVILPALVYRRSLFGGAARPREKAAPAVPSGSPVEHSVQDDLLAADERRLRAGMRPVIADATGLPFMMLAPDYLLCRLEGIAVDESAGTNGMKDYLGVLDPRRTGRGQGPDDLVPFGDACEFVLTNEWFFLRSEKGDVRRLPRAEIGSVARTATGIRLSFVTGPVFEANLTSARYSLVEAACRYRETRAAEVQA